MWSSSTNFEIRSDVRCSSSVTVQVCGSMRSTSPDFSAAKFSGLRYSGQHAGV